jgi:hypothetical protein
MLHREHWGPPPQSWIDYAVKNRVETGGILTKMTGKFPEFENVAKAALLRQGFPVKTLTSWINTHQPTAGVGYEKGYPHAHKNNDGLVLIHYLLPGDVPAPLDVFEREGGPIEESIYPEPGLTLYMPDGVWHGARKNNGTTNRVCFVIMGHR